MPNESMLEYLNRLFDNIEFPDAWVALIGTFCDGLIVSGPFMSKAEAISWAKANTADDSSWDVCRLYEAQ